MISGIKIDVKTIWKCKCGHHQDVVDGEEWPSHCKKLMNITSTYQLIPIDFLTLESIEEIKE
jgi:hypothetical protein